MSDKLRFVEKTHQYFLGELELPSVTTILQEVGLVDTQWYKPEHAWKGKAIHKATELVDTGEIDWGSLDPRMFPYIEAWEQFKTDYDVYLDEGGIEWKGYHKSLMYAGTIDRIGHVKGIRTIIDIKSGQKNAWHQLQLTAYREIYHSNIELYTDTVGVYLHDNGKYKLEAYKPDSETWNHVIGVYRWATA